MGSDVRFLPQFAKYVDVLCKYKGLGIGSGSVRVKDINSGMLSHSSYSCYRGDRFKLLIPYAGKSLTWEVLLNGLIPDEPPDFIFDPEDASFEPNFDNLPSLLKWDHENAHSLLNVIQELLAEYKRYQLSLIEPNSRLMWEYSSLIETEYREEDVEVHVTTKPGSRYSQMNFLIKLPVDFSEIPAYLCKDNPGEDSALLHVKFSTDGSRTVPHLYLSPRVENCLGGSSSLRIPVFPSGVCLLDYVPSVVELLSNHVRQIVQGFRKRREYISALLAVFSGSVLEFDTEGFTKISFLLEYLDFYFVLHFDLPLFFPIEQPTLTLQSVYRENYVKKITDYPYSPRWSGPDMAERVKSYILEYIPNFQRASVKGFSL